jgi:hypothetical protein
VTGDREQAADAFHKNKNLRIPILDGKYGKYGKYGNYGT